MQTDVIETRVALVEVGFESDNFVKEPRIVHNVVATCPDPKYAAICASALQERGVDVFYSIRETPKPEVVADACTDPPVEHTPIHESTARRWEVPNTKYDVLRSEVHACWLQAVAESGKPAAAREPGTEGVMIAWHTIAAKLHIALRNAASVKDSKTPTVESGAAAMAESLHRSQSPVMRRASGVAYANGWEGAIWDVAHRLGISNWVRRALDSLPAYADPEV